MAVWHFMLIIGNWHLSLDCVWFLSIKINCYFTGKSAWNTYVFILLVISDLFPGKSSVNIQNVFIYLFIFLVKLLFSQWLFLPFYLESLDLFSMH